MLLTYVEVKDSVAMAMASLAANKFRSGLTVLGVMIGVCSVIAIASVIDGLNGELSKEIDDMGSNIIMVTKFAANVSHEDMTDEDRNRPAITVGEAEAIQKGCPSVEGVSPQNYYFAPGGNEIKYKNRKASNPYLMGTWPDYVKVNNQAIGLGRFLDEPDQQNRTMVCVLGADMADALFDGEAAVGKDIRINGNLFQVIGVMEKVKAKLTGNDRLNTTALIPLSTFNKLYPWEKELMLIARAASTQKMDLAQEEITSVLRVYRKVRFDKDNNFFLSTQQQFKEMANKITDVLYIAAIVITSVGLMVGGIGVMNIMLVSVTERTREIGIRKAIGAKRMNVLLQFLTEAMALSGAGGIIGVIVGVLLGVGVNAIFGFPLSVSIVWIVIGFLVAVSVGMVSGMYPAIKASRLDPIDALRYE
jgi:putative ABC transport system permease protein